MISRPPSLIGKCGDLLRAVAGSEPRGATTTDVARHTGLPRATVHRLLSELEREGLLERGAEGQWRLGPELYLLGQCAAPRYDVTDQVRDVVTRLAADTGESAFFSIRRGEQTVCLLRRDGSFPLRSHVLDAGVRFPLGVASAGLVLLAHLRERDVETYLARSDLAAKWGPQHAPGPLRDRVAEVRERGYSVNPGLVVEGSWGVGAAVFDRSGAPHWALSLTGVESRFRADRVPELGARLLDAAHLLSGRLGPSDTFGSNREDHSTARST